MGLRRISALLLFFAILVQSGCVISPRRDSTTSGGGSSTGIGHLYVSDQSGNAIFTFANATGDSGNISATAEIVGSNTQLSNPQYIFSDTANDRLYVANLGAANILVFNSISTLSGTVNQAPTRVISSNNLLSPSAVAVDTSRDLLYVADTNAIVVFQGASGANGTTAASAIINPGFTPGALFINSSTDTLFATDSANNSVQIFDNASTLNGALTSNVFLLGSATQLNQPVGLQIDGAGRLLVSNSNASVTIYSNATTLNGNITPVAVIGGGQTTLSTPAQIAIDLTTNSGELYVADTNAGEVAVFTSITTTSGTFNGSPSRNITGLTTPRGVAIDTTH